jgi:hypothetical protein
MKRQREDEEIQADQELKAAEGELHYQLHIRGRRKRKKKGGPSRWSRQVANREKGASLASLSFGLGSSVPHASGWGLASSSATGWDSGGLTCGGGFGSNPRHTESSPVVVPMSPVQRPVDYVPTNLKRNREDCEDLGGVSGPRERSNFEDQRPRQQARRGDTVSTAPPPRTTANVTSFYSKPVVKQSTAPPLKPSGQQWQASTDRSTFVQHEGFGTAAGEADFRRHHPASRRPDNHRHSDSNSKRSSGSGSGAAEGSSGRSQHRDTATASHRYPYVSPGRRREEVGREAEFERRSSEAGSGAAAGSLGRDSYSYSAGLRGRARR